MMLTPLVLQLRVKSLNSQPPSPEIKQANDPLILKAATMGKVLLEATREGLAAASKS